MPDRVAPSVTCLSADTFLTADPGVESYIPVRSQSFVGIDHVIIPMAIFPLSADSRVICARSTGLTTKSSLPRKKSVVRLTYHPDRTIAVDWDVKHQPKQTKSIRLRASSIQRINYINDHHMYLLVISSFPFMKGITSYLKDNVFPASQVI